MSVNYIELLNELENTYKTDKKAAKILANHAGFTTYKNYRNHLKQIIGVIEQLKPEITETNIHVIDVVDCSGSMRGNKINAAKEGVAQGIDDLKKTNHIKYTYSLLKFSSFNDIKFLNFNEDIIKVDSNISNKLLVGGVTALYDAVAYAINAVKKLNTNNKVLINVYTDGGENDSRDFRKDYLLKELIESVKDFVTISWIGTNYDIDSLINKLNIDESNTRKYDGTAKGLEKSLNDTRLARQSYSTKVKLGEDVSLGFYKDIV